MGVQAGRQNTGGQQALLFLCAACPGAGYSGNAVAAGSQDEPLASLPVSAETFCVLKAGGGSWF